MPPLIVLPLTNPHLTYEISFFSVDRFLYSTLQYSQEYERNKDSFPHFILCNNYSNCRELVPICQDCR